jgi:hypothetical protein
MTNPEMGSREPEQKLTPEQEEEKRYKEAIEQWQWQLKLSLGSEERLNEILQRTEDAPSANLNVMDTTENIKKAQELKEQRDLIEQEHQAILKGFESKN